MELIGHDVEVLKQGPYRKQIGTVIDFATNGNPIKTKIVILLAYIAGEQVALRPGEYRLKRTSYFKGSINSLSHKHHSKE